MARKNKKKSGGDEGGGGGAPGWMVTFGDMMSLLLTFFVLLLSFSSIQDVEFQKALGSLQGALGVLPRNKSIISDIKKYLPRLSELQTKRFEKAAEELEELIKKLAMEENIQLRANKEGLMIRIDSPVLFELGAANIKSTAYPILDKVIELTANWSNNIRVEGHTDDLPIRTAQYPSNWELSTARALSVLRYFLKSGEIEPWRLSAVGYGEYHPIRPNDSVENRAKNRRVEIYVEPPKNQYEFKDDIL